MDTNDSRINWDTSVDSLIHGRAIEFIDLDEGELMHWKYIKREKMPNGKWRYYYDKEEMKNNLNKFVDKMKGGTKKLADKAADRMVKKANELTSGLNDFVKKGEELIGKLYDDPNNIYNVTRASYTRKLNEIKETAEWKKIVANKDSEYVKKNEDGSTSYLIDDYIVDKKHPVLDAIGDIAAGREISTQEITKDTVVAGLKDYATSAIELGVLSLGFLTNGLVKKFKFSQGSYDDDIAELADTVSKGADYLDTMYKTGVDVVSTATSVSPNRTPTADDIATAAGNMVSTLAANVSKEDIDKVASWIVNTTEAAKKIDEGDVVKAAQTLVESDALKERLGSNEYYQQSVSALSNLSEDEILLINMLIQSMRS